MNDTPQMPGTRRLLLFGDWWTVEVGHDAQLGDYASLATNEQTGETISTGQLYKTAEAAFLAILKAIKDSQ